MSDLSKKYKVLGDSLVIEFAKASETSKGGVIIPETLRKEDKGTGVIVLIGPDCKNSFELGQKVVMKGSGSIVYIDGKEYAQIPEYNIMGILLDANSN
jgi:co-chaperonin GroES (HSP10)